MTRANPRSPTRNVKPKRELSSNVPPGLHLLLSLDPQSAEFLELFGSYLSSKDERTNVLALSEPDTKLFIEIVDRALRAAQLDTKLRQLAFCVLRRLCGRMGHLPDSYLLSAKLDLSGMSCASGGFADVRMGVFRGKNVAVKTVRVLEGDDKLKIRKHFCKEVALWKNLSHPNLLNLIGVPDTLEDGKFSMVSEWMTNGNIMMYVRSNAGNHLKLLADAIEGLKYLHNANIAHGDLKGANILITNTNPVSACLADFGFMTIVHDPSLEMESSKVEVGGGTTPFMAPELLVPPRFGLDRCTPTKEADIYAMGMVVYQVLTGTLPFGKMSKYEVVVEVLRGERPSKPANALELGLSDEVWKLLEDCWQTDRISRPLIRDVSTRVKGAASVCSILPSVRGIPQRVEDPDSNFAKFDKIFLDMPSDDEEPGVIPMERPPSQESTFTNTSLSNSLFSELLEAESPITEKFRASVDELTYVSCSDALPDTFFSPGVTGVAHIAARRHVLTAPSVIEPGEDAVEKESDELKRAGIFPSNKELSPADSNTNPRQSGNKSGISIRHSEVESHEMHVELWKDVTNTGDEGKAVQTLAKILLYKEGRTFISSLAREDAEFCIEILDHGLAKYNLDIPEKQAFFVALRRLAGIHGRLPASMTIIEEFRVSDKVFASGGVADVRTGMCMGHLVAVKAMRVAERDGFLKIRKQFCKEVVLWNSLSHPNILKLLGVYGDMNKGQFITLSEWMIHGSIVEFIRKNHVNRLRLLHEAAQGLEYLHGVNLVHGDIKGENIYMSNDTSPRACLADFGFMTMVLNPGQPMSCSAKLEGGTMMFMAPELLVPGKFGFAESIPTPETDIYAFGLVIYQVLTGELPFPGVRMGEITWNVVQGVRPTKPKYASAIGLSDSLWSFVQRCWDGERKLRPKIAEVVSQLRRAAVDWDGIMPPCAQDERVVPACPEPVSDTMTYCGIFA